MTKKKKNLFTLLGLCAVLVVFIVLYLVVPKGSSDETASADSTAEPADTITVDSIDTDQIESITVKREEDTTLSLKKTDGTWQFTSDTSIPLDASAVTALFDCLSTVKATKELDKNESTLADYGLDKPAMTIQVKTSDGGDYQYQLGSTVPVAGGYYGLASSGDKIYCMQETLFSTFDIESNSLIEKDELPEINADYMTYIHVDNKKGKDFEAKTVSAKEQVDKYSSWNITQPYDKALATSTKDWTTTLGYFNSLSFGELVEYNSGNLDKYGLKNPSSVITLKYYEKKDDYTPVATATPSTSNGAGGADIIPEKYRNYKSLELCIGKKAGESYYVCIKGSNNVYTMDSSSITNMTGLDAYTSMDHCVYATLATDIKGYDVSYGSKTLHMTRIGTKDSDGKDKNIWKIDGNEIGSNDEDTFLTPYSSAYLLEFTAKASNSVKPKSTKPVLTIVYHENSRDVTVKYLPYDGTNFYRVDKDGMDYFLVDKRSVDDIITQFKDLEKFI